MQGIRMHLDWQRIYEADTSLGTLSVLVYTEADSDDALMNPEHQGLLVEIANAISDARLGIVYGITYHGSQDLY